MGPNMKFLYFCVFFCKFSVYSNGLCVKVGICLEKEFEKITSKADHYEISLLYSPQGRFNWHYDVGCGWVNSKHKFFCFVVYVIMTTVSDKIKCSQLCE